MRNFGMVLQKKRLNAFLSKYLICHYIHVGEDFSAMRNNSVLKSTKSG